MIARVENGGEISGIEHMTISSKSKKLLVKFSLITVNYLVTFVPLEVSWIIMMATSSELSNEAELSLLVLIEVCLLLNPILIYHFDARLKRSVNSMFWKEKATQYALQRSGLSNSIKVPKNAGKAPPQLNVALIDTVRMGMETVILPIEQQR